MGTTAQRNKNLTRPTKGGTEKARRQREQKKRLVALGMDEAAVAKLNAKETRIKLRHPAKVAKACAAKKA